MTFKYLFAAVVLTFLAGQAHGQAAKNLQSCEGTIGVDKDGGQLQLTDIKKNPSPWCDAYIGMDKNDEIAKRVLAQCPLGSRCVIEGTFAGRGVFYWTKIMSANLKREETIQNMKAGRFRMPSDQIHCMFVTGEGNTEPNAIECEINATFIRTPVRPRPKDCEYDWGQLFELGNDRDADLKCVSDSVRGEDSAVLAYGKSVRQGKIVCSSEQTGLTCSNAKGHGFFLSKAVQKIF